MDFGAVKLADLSAEASWTVLGKGSFGTVFKGAYLGLEVALKEVHPSTEYDFAKYLARETHVLQSATHPNIVQFLGIVTAPPRLLLVSEYLPRGNLSSYIHHKHLPLPWRLRLSFAIDIVRALAYLHARQCLHRDLKGENLLITDNLRVKMTDFGFARLAAQNAEEAKRLTSCGTDGYMAPELIHGEEFSLPVDIYSLGVVLAELSSRKLVDSETYKRQMPSFGLDFDEVRRLAAPDCPPAFLALVLACIALEPAERPTALDVLHQLGEIETALLAQEGPTWSVGSTGYGGLKAARTSAPRLPSFISVESDTSFGESGREEEEIARLAEADVQLELGLSHWGLGDDPEEEGPQYSTTVVGRGSSIRAPLEAAASSTLTVVGRHGARYDPSSVSLPSIPSSWITGLHVEEPSVSSDASVDVTPTPSALAPIPITQEHEPIFLSSFSSLPPVAGSSFLLVPPPTNTAQKLLHRFSLLRPGWWFLSSLTSAPGGGGIYQARKSEDALGRTGAAGAGGRCGVCEKKFGMLKTFLECDDCGYRCHIACVAGCSPHCEDELPLQPITPVTTPGMPTRAPPSPPKEGSRIGSKLLKKRPTGKN